MEVGNKADLLSAMKADAIPEGWSNLWWISKMVSDKPLRGLRNEQSVVVPAGSYTFLRCVTDSTMYCEPPGEVVMEDSPHELETHLGFVLQAYGRVLVTGLGLGCVVRGLLANPNVRHVTCIEQSRDVLKLVAPHMPTDRLTIVEAEALEWTAKNTEVFDCAWHDLWTDRDQGEPHLDIWHSRLLTNLRDTVVRQGAWAMDRRAKALLIKRGFRWMG